MDMKIAYSTLVIKAMEEDGKRIFRGIATTPTPDRAGDIVEPKGAEFQLPIPFLWMHNSRDPVGWVTACNITDKGIEIVGEIANLPEPASLKERLDTAWAMLKGQLVRGLSIGFKPLEEARIGDTYSYRYLKWLWLELSAVVIAANGDCSITTIKSIDTALRMKRKGVVMLDLPPKQATSESTAGAAAGTAEVPVIKTIETTPPAASGQKLGRVVRLR